MLLSVTTGQTAVTTYCCDAAAESAYLSDLTALGVQLSTVHEGFDFLPWGTATDLRSGGFSRSSVINQGITWTPLSTNSGGGFATSTGGGDTHDGSHLMYAVDSGDISHPIPDGYALSATVSTWHGVGGWFRSTNGAKLAFIVDGNTSRVDFTGVEATVNDWKFLGFIDDTDGFTDVEIQTSDEVGNEIKIFFADDFSIGTTASIVNSAPVAIAGADQSALVGDTVTLDGSGSRDADGDQLVYAWLLTDRPVGSVAALSDVSAVISSFEVDLAGTYVAQLIVNDGTVDSAPATVTISTENTAPVADAGADQSALVGDTVTLDGSGSSDMDGDLLVYTWSLTSRPVASTVVLSDTTAVMPNLEIDLAGTYVAQLIVNDGASDSAPATVTISTENNAPVADAGANQSALVGDRMTLDGSGSGDIDGDPLAYAWSLTSRPEGSLAVLSDATAVMPNLEIDLAGTYVAQLIVNDGRVDSVPATVTISTENTAPVADAGADQNALLGDTVMLDASGSGDADGDPLAYAWSLTSRPEASTAVLSDTAAMMPSIAVDLAGTYVAQLIVNDGALDSAPATVTIIADRSDLVINEAAWSARNRELEVSGSGEPGQQVVVRNASTREVLGYVRVSPSALWELETRIFSRVPCRVQAESTGKFVEAVVEDAPWKCDSGATHPLRFKRALWRAKNKIITVKGRGRPGEDVVIRRTDNGQILAVVSITGKRGKWREKIEINGATVVPCQLIAESYGEVATRNVARVRGCGDRKE